MARPEEHRSLIVQDAQAFGDSTTSVSIDRSVARTRVEELRVLEEDRKRVRLPLPRPRGEELRLLEEDGTRLGLLLPRNQPVFWGGRPVPASQLSGLSVGAEHRGRGGATDLVHAYPGEVHPRAAAPPPPLSPAPVPLSRRAGYQSPGTCTV